MQIITEIMKDVALLKSLNHSNDLDSRLRLAERLAANTCYLAEIEADAYNEMSSLETQYENAVAGDEDAYEGAATKAKAHAKNKNKDLNFEVSKAKGLHKRLQSLRSQVNTVIEQTRQTIAHLRDERRNSGY